MDEKARLWAIVRPGGCAVAQGELTASSRMRTQRVSRAQIYCWLAIVILSGVILLLLFGDKQLWDKTAQTSRRIRVEVLSLTRSVGHQVADLALTGSSRSSVTSSEKVGPIELVSQNLKEGSPITPRDLRMRSNPAGQGTIVYSPYYFGVNHRLAWIVLDGHAYSLTPDSRSITPSLPTCQAVPWPLWRKTGLSREQALSQLESYLWS